jgi:hypothetical protein
MKRKNMSRKIKIKKPTPLQFLQSINIDYDNLNNLPNFPYDYNIDTNKLPYFYEIIVDNDNMTNESYREFATKFFFYYYFSDEFKERVKNYYILLLKDQYCGVFKDPNEAVKYAIDRNVPGFQRETIRITPIIETINKQEYTSTVS